MSQGDPDLQVLSKYVGTWEVAATSQDGPAAEGEYTSNWILDGWFVQSTGSVKTADGSNDFAVQTLMTYDRARQIYRRWSFMSDGLTSESEGTWDSTSQTMTLITKYGKITQTSTSNFAKPGVEEWIMVNTDQSGKIISEMRGTNIRRNE